MDTAQIRASGQYALPPETPCDKPERSDVSGDGLFSQRHYCRVADDLAELSPFRGKNFDLPTMWQALVHLDCADSANGYIVSTGCDIPVNASADNVLAFMDEVRAFGPARLGIA